MNFMSMQTCPSTVSQPVLSTSTQQSFTASQQVVAPPLPPFYRHPLPISQTVSQLASTTLTQPSIFSSQPIEVPVISTSTQATAPISQSVAQVAATTLTQPTISSAQTTVNMSLSAFSNLHISSFGSLLKTSLQPEQASSQESKKSRKIFDHFEKDLSGVALEMYLKAMCEIEIKVISDIQAKVESLVIVDPALIGDGKNVPKIASESAAKFIEDLDAFDESLLLRGLNEGEKLFSSRIFNYLEDEITRLVDYSPLFGPILSGKRIEKILALYFFMAAQDFNAELRKNSPFIFVKIAALSKESREGFLDLMDTVLEMAPKLVRFSQTELQELHAKITKEKIGDIDLSQFSIRHGEEAQKMIRTLKNRLAQDKDVGEALLEGFIAVFATMIKVQPVEPDDSKQQAK